jgi:hypothetical protein
MKSSSLTKAALWILASIACHGSHAQQITRLRQSDSTAAGGQIWHMRKVDVTTQVLDL